MFISIIKCQKLFYKFGGGELVTQFINKGLLDKMIITIIPKIIGEGIKLLPNKPIESNWKLLAVKSLDTSAVILTY